MDCGTKTPLWRPGWPARPARPTIVIIILVVFLPIVLTVLGVPPTATTSILASATALLTAARAYLAESAGEGKRT